MKRLGALLVGITGLAMILFLGNPAVGGEYHSGATLICSECHVMHFSQSHGYNPNGSGNFTSLGSAPYGYLLRNDINNLCLSCHDGLAFAPDVFEGPTAAIVRQGGALNEVGGNGLYPPPTGHTLGETSTPPGGTWTPDATEGLMCTNCHEPHGRGGPSNYSVYRNLAGDPADTGTRFDGPSYAVSTNDITKDVFVRNITEYDISDVDFNEPDATASSYANWCGACHTDFHGAADSANIGGSGTPPEHFDRHPVAGVDIGAIGGGHSSKAYFAYGSRTNATTKLNWVKVMTSTGDWEPNDATQTPWDYTPSCMTCHKAHGNQNAFGLIQMNSLTGAKTEEGTAAGTYKDLCKQCHVQG